MGSRSFAVKCEVQHQFDRKNSYLVAEFSAKMGVNQSKGSVNITSTPNKGSAPAVENGKKVVEEIIADEKIISDDTTKINGDVEKVTTNGDAKKEEVVEEETKAEPEAEEPAKESDETVEEAAGDKTTSEKKKTSTKDKIKKRLSIRSINFLKRKKKEDKEETNDSKNETKEDIPEEKAEEKEEEKKEADDKEAEVKEDK